jgi:hypothetical protein
MARVNIDEELFTDPRMMALRISLSEAEAYGLLVIFWRLGQQYWKKKGGPFLIPTEVFNMIPKAENLVRCSFAFVRENGVYCAGAEERWKYLLNDQKVAAGKKSAESRQKSKGTAQPNDPRTTRSKNPNDGPNEIRTRFNETEHYSYSSPSSSPSSSSSAYASSLVSEGGAKAPPPRADKELNAVTWKAYETAYFNRYKAEPVRNATVNGQISNLVKRLGKEAPDVVRYYVEQDRPFYNQSCHPVGLCLKDAEALRTQWATGHTNPVHKNKAELLAERAKRQIEMIDRGEL